MIGGTLVSWEFLYSTSMYNGTPAVQWTATARQIHDAVFKVRFIATLAPGLALFSQCMPDTPGKYPTGILFKEDQKLKLLGQTTETGDRCDVYEDMRMIFPDRSQKISYHQSVEFLDRTKANINGIIRFQACSEDLLFKVEMKEFDIQVKR